jgi:hypothetical protein
MKSKTFVPWTMGEIRILRRLAANRMSASVIHRSGFIPRHTEFGISYKMSALGLGDPKAQEKARNARRLSASQKEEVISFLRTEGRNLPSRDAATILGISQRMVTHYRSQHHLCLSNHLRFTSSHFLEKHSHVLQALQQGLRKHRSAFWEKRRKHMRSQLAQSRNLAVELLRCRKCQDEWPSHPRYFYLGRRGPSGEPKIQTVCRACGNA